MHKLLSALLLYVFASSAVIAEDVPAPVDENARYYIEIPKGGLLDFFQYTPMRVPMVSHHRGGPIPGYPENAIETMDHALKYGPGLMEVDVAQLKDGTLILMHDYTLDRTTTGTGKFKEVTWDYVKTLKLKDNDGALTEYKVPLLRDVLNWAKGRAILTLDIKRGTDFKKVVELVKETGAEDYTAAIAYTHKQAIAFNKMAPDMPITIGMMDKDDIKAIEESGIPSDRVIAWTGTREKSAEFYREIHGKGWRVIMGTLGRPDRSIDGQIAANDNDQRYLEIFQKGADVIATDRFWAVKYQIQNPNFFFFVKKSVSAK